MAHAVQHGKNHRFGSHGGSEVIYGSGKRIALHGEQDQVIGTANLLGRRGLGMQSQIPVRAEDLKTVRMDLFCALRANQKRDIPASLSQTAAKIPADGTCTDY